MKQKSKKQMTGDNTPLEIEVRRQPSQETVLINNLKAAFEWRSAVKLKQTVDSYESGE